MGIPAEKRHHVALGYVLDGLRGLLPILRRNGAVLALLAMVIALSIVSPHFLTWNNLINLVRQVSIYAIVAVGMTFVIITAGIDLSVGSVMSITSIAMATLMVDYGWNGPAALLLGLAFGGLIGLLNGLMSTKVGLPPFIATLGMMSVTRGLGYVYTNGAPIYGLPAAFRWIGNGMIGPVPVPVVLMLLVVIIGHFLLMHTKLGRYCFAIGGNEEAATLSGIRVDRYKIAAYAMTGVLSALAGAIMAARLNAAAPTAGDGYELDIIAATVIGGVSLMGGHGSVLGSLVGALIMGVVRNGLNLLVVSPNWQRVVIGGIILLAVAVDVYGKRRRH